MAGSTNSIAYLAKGLAAKGHRVVAGIRRESLLWNLLEGSPVYRVAMNFRGKFDFHNWRQIRNTVKEHDIRVINAQSSHDRYTSIFANWLYKLGCHVVHTRRQMPASMGDPLQLYLYNKKTTGIVAVSHQVKEKLVKLGIKEAHVAVIHNGTPREKYKQVDEQKLSALRHKFGITAEDFVVGCISRPKSQRQIFEALKLIERPLKVIFGGLKRNEPYASLAAEVEDRHQLFFEGDIPGSEVLNYYKLFDLKVLASTTEGLSQSLLEAMSLRVPIIATACGGNLDLIQDGENGLLFKDGDVQKLAQNIESLRDHAHLRSKLMEAGFHTAFETHNIENTVSNYEKYFWGILNVEPVPPPRPSVAGKAVC